MKKTGEGENGLITQYREVVPEGYRLEFFERDDLIHSAQIVVSQNYTTYSVGEAPIPVLANLRRA
ncbi:MAG TPA: hypothetical protein VJR47_03470 [Stellaceae bacterium]|nr:hypothetical protein [Stellaceae bacterium]